MELLYHIRPYFVGIFPYIGLNHRPYIWNRYLLSIGSWVMTIDMMIETTWIFGSIDFNPRDMSSCEHYQVTQNLCVPFWSPWSFKKQDAAHEPECSHVCQWHRCQNTWICSHAQYLSAIVYLNSLVHVSLVTTLQCGVASVECGVCSVK